MRVFQQRLQQAHGFVRRLRVQMDVRRRALEKYDRHAGFLALLFDQNVVKGAQVALLGALGRCRVRYGKGGGNTRRRRPLDPAARGPDGSVPENGESDKAPTW